MRGNNQEALSSGVRGLGGQALASSESVNREGTEAADYDRHPQYLRLLQKVWILLDF